MELKGAVALVVGGTGGIGFGIAQALAGEGCRVVVTGLESGPGKQALEPLGIREVLCDITDRSRVAELYTRVQREMGPVEILVNSAGTNVGNRMMANIAAADFDMVMAVNTTGVFNCIREALPGMRARRSGLILNIISLAGLRVMPMAGLPYCVSKFAASALGTFVGMEEAANGIKVTNIYPGETNTPLVDRRPAPPPAEKRAQMIQPEDIGAMVVAIARLPARAIVPELVITPPHMLLG
jgi:NAD(P)-dependent dehydrogenase (short-subunit alcohol dehydrogenase family)